MTEAVKTRSEMFAELSRIERDIELLEAQARQLDKSNATQATQKRKEIGKLKERFREITLELKRTRRD